MKQLKVLQLVVHMEKAIFKNVHAPMTIYGFIQKLQLDSLLDFREFVDR